MAGGVTLTVGDGGYLSVSTQNSLAGGIPLSSGLITGAITVENGGTLALASSTELGNATITNRGTIIIYAHVGSINGQSSVLRTYASRIVNEAGGVVFFQSGSVFGDLASQSLTLVNHGTVRIPENAASFRFGANFVLSGTGTYDVPAGTTLVLARGSPDSFRATGLGRVEFAHNTVFSGTYSGNLTLPQYSTVTMSNAVIEGTLTYPPSATLEGTLTVGTNGIVVIPGTAAGQAHSYIQAVITNYGTIRSEGFYGTIATAPSAIYNMPSGLIELAGNLNSGLGDTYFGVHSEFKIWNAGTIRRLGNNELYPIQATLENYGTIDVQSGSLYVSTGSTNLSQIHGTLLVTNGAVLDLYKCSLAEVVASGQGIVRLNGTECVLTGNISGNYETAAHAYLGGEGVLQQGTLKLDAGSALKDIILTIGETATLDFSKQSYRGIINLAGTITNKGLIHFGGTIGGDLNAAYGVPSLLVNEPSGRVIVDGSAGIAASSTSTIRLVNRGLFRVAGSNAVFSLYDAPLENSGRIEVSGQGSRLGAERTVGSNPAVINGGVIEIGDGVVDITTGSLTLLTNSVLRLLVADPAQPPTAPQLQLSYYSLPLSLAGVVEPWVRPGFTPALGSQYPVIYAVNGFTGQFAGTDNHNLTTRAMLPIYGVNTISLETRSILGVAQGPAGRIVGPGAPVTLTATASGDAPFAYQWRLNGTDIPGATNASHTLNPTGPGQFTVVVTNVVGQVESAPATVSLFSMATRDRLVLAGPLGGAYRIEYRNELGPASAWQTATNFTLTTSPAVWIDQETPRQPRRFYRAVLVP